MSFHFYFCPLVWHFCGETNTKMLERLHYWALRFVFDDHESDYEDLLSRANMPSLELGRLRGLCIEVFKCIHNLAPQYMSCVIYFSYKIKIFITLEGPRPCCNIIIIKSGIYGAKTFVTYSTSLWNHLSEHTRAAADLETFQSLMDQWYGLECQCNFCKLLQDYNYQ